MKLRSPICSAPLLVATASLFACAPPAKSPEASAPAKTEAAPAAAEPAAAAPTDAATALPEAIAAEIRKEYVFEGMETRYLDGAVDLDGDGTNEIVVHVVGGGACGTGGCPTLVYRKEGEGYRRVSTISVSRPPIRVAGERSNGWRNLVVHIGGGGGATGDVEMLFDGTSYPGNPTGGSAGTRPFGDGAADVLIADFTDFSAARPLP
ncbi:MAG: hypothetical protein AB7G12_04860 [Thermoanaerobaculia bacterium]